LPGGFVFLRDIDPTILQDIRYAGPSAIGRQGFVNYSKECWHFSLPGAGRAAYDFPITARQR
jgi:D-alanyl-D-alanine dipeptidase